MMKQFAAGSCYFYILSSRGEALVIDPHISLFDEYAGYLKKKGLTLKYIIDTHTHADHFSLAAVLKKKLGAKVVMGEKAISSVADIRLKDNDQITIGTSTYKAIYTPGHTDDAMSIYGENMLFTGDVLLIGSVGRTDFQNGSPESMFDTLQKIKALPDSTKICPGHDYHGKLSSTLGKEKGSNPFLKATDKAAFVKDMRSKTLSKPYNIDNIIRLNQKGEAVALEMIEPQDAAALAVKESKVKFLDVRTPAEFSEVHIKDAVHVPIDTIKTKINELSQSQQNFVVVCRTGNRAFMAADMLQQAGIHGIKVMQGGMVRWKKVGLPVIKAKTPLSVERQVQGVAGFMVLCGIVLSWLLHWAFIFISVFVGCGLIFSSLTGSCPMGLMLMKLPYNRKAYTSQLSGGTCAISG